MKLSLKIKLTISYIFLALFLVSALLVVSNYFLQQKFQKYIIDIQEKENLSIVELVENEFENSEEQTLVKNLENIGNTALSQGIILMVSDMAGNELFCMSTLDSQMCDNMIESMRAHMASIYPNFKGEYMQKEYEVLNNSQLVGSVTLGYYGPFYYNDEDIQFLKVLNQVLLITAFVFLIFAALLGFYMAGRITEPIKKVIDKTKQIEMGNFENRMDFHTNTQEINQLVHSVNGLAATLEKQQQSKKRMARDYAHELRTPLATLQSSLEAMIDGIWEPTPERLNSCREEILRLTRMLTDLDKLVKIENENIVLMKSEFDLSKVVEQVALMSQPELLNKNIHLNLELFPFKLFADKDKIAQVIINLLSNAIKYTDDNGEILLNVHYDKEEAVFIIKDSGIGIAKEEQDEIFSHLYRTDKSRARNTGGSGIGLAVTKAIVEAHKGKITVNSQPKNGSQFTVILPLHNINEKNEF